MNNEMSEKEIFECLSTMIDQGLVIMEWSEEENDFVYSINPDNDQGE